MQPDFPDIPAIVPLIEQVLPHAHHLYRDASSIEPKELVDFVKKTQPIHLKRIDDPNNPLIKVDENGKKVLYLLWGHPTNLLDTDFLVSIVCPLVKDSKGMEMYKPSVVMRGRYANVIVVGGMACCGAALQTHWSQTLGDSSKPIDDSRVPVSGLPNREHAHWLKGKIHVAETSEGVNALNHMAMDMLAHRFPNDRRFSHDCGAKADYEGYGEKAQTLTL